MSISNNRLPSYAPQVITLSALDHHSVASPFAALRRDARASDQVLPDSPSWLKGEQCPSTTATIARTIRRSSRPQPTSGCAGRPPDTSGRKTRRVSYYSSNRACFTTTYRKFNELCPSVGPTNCETIGARNPKLSQCFGNARCSAICSVDHFGTPCCRHSYDRHTSHRKMRN